jgi:Xaa-Pro aminopeptidase
VSLARWASRRTALLAALPPGAVVVLATAPVVLRNGDNEYPYRHDSGFYYLTGFTEPDSAVVLVGAGPAGPARALLFCRARNPTRELWDGFRYGPEAARSAFGFDAAWPIEDLDAEVIRLLSGAPGPSPMLYYAHGGALEAQAKTWLHSARQRGSGDASAASASASTCAGAADLLPLLDELRVIKDDDEQGVLRRAAGITAQALCRAMAATRPGMAEYAIEAELLYEFRRHGAQGPAYTPIVAAGANGCILHYNSNSGRAADGALVLIDAGCELDGYAADISRTYPANGRFTTAQATLYDIVLAAQAAALEAVRPGRPYEQIHAAAVRVLAEGMLDVGLLSRDRHGGIDDVLADRSYLPFYMHGTGHWLGMDVHDTGRYRESAQPGAPSRPLQPGMVLTVEPGLYVRPGDGVPERFWHTGIRIEDDVLVTPDGHAVLSDGVPKTRAAIEQLMRDARPA